MYIIFPSDIDDCSSSSCLNGATCVDGVNSFKCQCVKGYDGDRCENGKSSRANAIW